VQLADLPWGRLGLTICYDVRFPQLHNALALAGADVIAQPAAFTRPTGEAHWHVLLRARAIETGAFIVAAAQTGEHQDGRETFGHSLAIDPWGRVLLDMGTEPGIAMVELDLAQVADTRARIPNLRHARAFGTAEVADAR
jgi:predicted amidohydrolase